MATLTNPINTQNIVDRFADYVVATANSGISWGINAVPFSDFPTSYFGGPISGMAIEINGSSIGNTGTAITAANIFNTLVAETNRYTKIRNLRALLTVTGSTGYAKDVTARAFMNNNYQQSVSVDNSGVVSGNSITSTNLENLFNGLRAQFSALAENTVVIEITVCHNSCHSSCHSSRGRR